MVVGGRARRARVGDGAGQRGDGGGDRRAKIDGVVAGAAAAREVAVEGAQAARARRRHVADTRARAARGLGDVRAGSEQIGEEPLARHHFEDARAAGKHDERDRRRHALPPDRVRHRPHVLPRAIGAGTDDDLLDGGTGDLGDGHHAVGGARERHQRLERVQVEVDLLVVQGVGVGGERLPVGRASQEREVLARGLVGREHARRRPELGAHVADGCALGQRQRGGAGAHVLEDPSGAAADGVTAQELEDDVLGRHPGPEAAGEADAHDLRHGQVIGAAAHGHRHVEPARADGEHAGGAAERRVAVGAEEELPRHAEGLEVHLVADAVAGLGEPRPVAARRRLHVTVVVRVPRVDGVDVVVDVGDDARRADAREPQRLELEQRHRPVGVGEQDLVDGERDLLAGHGLARHEVSVDQLAREAQSHGGIAAVRRVRGRGARAPIFLRGREPG